MLKPGPAKKLIVTVNETDRWHGRSVCNALLLPRTERPRRAPRPKGKRNP
jgi:hypothetical protein